MSQDISKNNNNDKRGLDDLAWIEELYQFLQGKSIPEGMMIKKSVQPKLSEKKAETIIWFLQEHLRVLPDNINRCDACGSLYDENQGGHYTDNPFKGMYSFCEGCQDQLPDEYFNS